MAEVDVRLTQVFAEHTHDAGYRIPVIVTLAPESADASLTGVGMTLTGKTDHVPIVFGTVDAAALERLSQTESVTRIELDDEGAHILKDLDR